MLARVLRQAGRFDDAQAAARRAVELEPDDADYDDTLGRILRQMHLFDQAEREHRQAIALSDESALCHEGLGRLLADMAAELGQDQGRIGGDLHLAGATVSHLAVTPVPEQQLLREAAMEFSRAIDLDPKFPDAYVGLAVTTSWAEGADALGRAVELLQRASDLDRRSYDARRNLGLALLHLGDHRKASEVLSSIDPPNDAEQDLDLHFNLGVARLHQGDMTGAETAFREATKLNPLDSDAQVNPGISLYEESRFDDAFEAFVNAIRINANNPDAQLALSQAYFTKGQFCEGEQAFRRAAKHRSGALRLRGLVIGISGWGGQSNGSLSMLARFAPSVVRLSWIKYGPGILGRGIHIFRLPVSSSVVACSR
jgi:tetratricopeptide (TPR) repeat protein